MKYLIHVFFVSVFLGNSMVYNAFAQRVPLRTDSSVMAGIHFPQEAQVDRRILSVAAARTVLEMEASKYNIKIADVEVYAFPVTDGNVETARAISQNILKTLERSGYECHAAEGDPSYVWLGAGSKKVLMYLSSTRKQTDLYFGLAGSLPPSFSTVAVKPAPDVKTEISATANPAMAARTAANVSQAGPAAADKSGISANLAGYWGTISGSKINYQDGTSGMIVASGVSRGFGLQLKEDGTYLQVTVVNSGIPTYRIFVSTTGTWKVSGNQLIFSPTDRHYRKWDNEIKTTDEHSVPEPYSMIWILQSNQNTGKECLYVKYTADQPAWEELCRE